MYEDYTMTLFLALLRHPSHFLCQLSCLLSYLPFLLFSLIMLLLARYHYVALANLEFFMQTRLTQHSLRSTCFCFSSASIKDVHHNSWPLSFFPHFLTEADPELPSLLWPSIYWYVTYHSDISLCLAFVCWSNIHDTTYVA